MLRKSDGGVLCSTLLQWGGYVLIHDGIIYGCGQDHSITALRASDGSRLWDTSLGWDSRLYALNLCFITYPPTGTLSSRRHTERPLATHRTGV